MELLTLMAIVCLFHVMLCFIDHFLKSCMNIPYFMFLSNVGLTIKPCQIHVFSSIFNRLVTRWSFDHKRFFKWWFIIGTVVVILLLIPSMVLMFKSLMVQLISHEESKSQQVLLPVIPGVNLPVREFPIYFWTLLLCSLIHEIGHAVAAAREDVHINGFGFMLLFILPGAYVDLPTEGVRNLSPFRQLKIFCAGVWHNIVLCGTAFLFGLLLPHILQLLYFHSNGALVLDVHKSSPVRGPTGLQFGDVITSVNRCPIETIYDLKKCLIKNSFEEQIGFCIPEDIVNANDETINHAYVQSDGAIECCDHEESSRLCFELKQDDATDKGETPMHPYSCLPGRIAISSSSSTCVTSRQCHTEGHYCLAPSFRNASRLLHIIKRNIFDYKLQNEVIFLGQPSDIFFTVTYTNYIPKYSFLSYYLPNSMTLFLDYVVKFSGGLGILNLIPCFYLDGFHIAGALIDLLFGNKFDDVCRYFIHGIVSMIGTVLLLLTAFCGIYSLL